MKNVVCSEHVVVVQFLFLVIFFTSPPLSLAGPSVASSTTFSFLMPHLLSLHVSLLSELIPRDFTLLPLLLGQVRARNFRADFSARDSSRVKHAFLI